MCTRKWIRTLQYIKNHLLDTNAKNAQLLSMCTAVRLPPQWPERRKPKDNLSRTHRRKED